MRWFRRQPSVEHGARGAPFERRDGESDRSAVERLAHQHLGPELGQRWSALLRPGVALIPSTAEEHPVARLGGLPTAPAGFTWPEWEGHGPLTFVAEVDLDALSSAGLDPGLPLPERGRLLAFYYDGSYRDDPDAVVVTSEPETLSGARLVHVDAGADTCVQQRPPGGVVVLPEKHLAGRQSVTFPTWEHPIVRQALGRRGESHRRWMSHPVNDDAFLEALDELRERDEPGHQIGGWADHIQGPVEDEVAEAALGGGRVDPSGPALAAEAGEWTLLLQVGSESEDELTWGDLGALYWMVRRERLPLLDEVSFTWQCG